MQKTAWKGRHLRHTDVLVVTSADYSFLGSLTHSLSHGRYSGRGGRTKSLKNSKYKQILKKSSECGRAPARPPALTQCLANPFSNTQHAFIVVVCADDLHAQRQPLRSGTRGDGDAGRPEQGPHPVE